MNFVNDKFVSLINEDRSSEKEKFKRVFLLPDIKLFKFPGWCASDLKKSLRDLVDEFFPQIHALWVKIRPKIEILRSNNSPFSTGKHRSPKPDDSDTCYCRLYLK